MAINYDLPLISTCAVGFTAAFICGMIAARFRLSPIVGYLVAGILIGPFTPGVIADVKIAEQLSEIGILLLMFGVGLHLSMRDLMNVRHIAIPGAIVQMTVATGLGLLMGHFWGWPLASSLLFGLSLSVASTVVLLRALEEHNMLQSTNGNIMVGWLLVEDITMVLALVLISALNSVDTTTADQFTWIRDFGWALGKMLLFIAFMLIGGKRLFPWLLAEVARTRSRELFTLAVFTVAIGVAFFAAKLFGVSFALGAFLAGMMIRESDLAHEAADKALPLQDAFAVLFFVSVGMLFDPLILIQKPWHVLALVAIIMIGKSLAAMAIVLFMRYPFKTALLVSAGLAQIGEFSFILANLGIHYNLLPDEARDLILAAALITISLNPALFHFSKRVYTWVLHRPKVANMFRISTDDDLAHLKAIDKQALKQPVILVGHGRVGKHISKNIHKADIYLVVVDANRERVAELREHGFQAIAGDAAYEETLKAAAIDQAVAIVVAVPNPFEARRIVETARSLKPEIKVLVRAHNDTEIDFFQNQKVDLAVMGPREVARRMVEYLQTQIPPPINGGQ